MTISAGSPLPPLPKSAWELEPEKSVELPTSGKILIIGVPGAYTPPCSDHVPGYLSTASAIASKGVKAIYVIAVNDIFVTKAWKKHLLSLSEYEDAAAKVHFIADATGEYTKSLGLEFDASGLLGGVRSKRYAALVEDGVVKNVWVEDEAPNLTVSTADAVLKHL